MDNSAPDTTPSPAAGSTGGPSAADAPDLLLVGHVTRDLIGETPAQGHRLGGTVSFAAVTALRMRRRPTIITRGQSAADLDELPNEVARILLPSDVTTTFANVYMPGGRVQHVYTPAAPITAADIPSTCHSARIVLLGPFLVNEIGRILPLSLAMKRL